MKTDQRIRLVSGDMFATPWLRCFAHGCNRRGVMGAGVAKAVRDRWPDLYKHYRNFCLSGQADMGYCLFWVTKDGEIIFNLFTQDGLGPVATSEALYSAIQSMVFVARAIFGDSVVSCRIGLPLIGSGIGGLSQKTSEETTIAAYENCSGPRPILYVFKRYYRGQSAQLLDYVDVR